MAISQPKLDSFNAFVTSKMSDPDITLDEVRHLWRLQHPTSEEHAENIAAANAAVADYKMGDRGRPERELTQEGRNKLYANPDEVTHCQSIAWSD